MAVEPAVLHTLFEPCNDIAATRAFYSELLGLSESFYDGGRGWLTYQPGPVQIVFTVAESHLEPVQEWSRMPAWDAGSVDHPSWVFRLDLAAFDQLCSRLAERSAPALRRDEAGGALRRVFLLDPMGKTVELYYEADQEQT